MTIDNLHREFREIIQILNNVKSKFDSINTKIKKLKDVYDDLTNTNHDPVYIFGLDFLNFQYKIFHNQYKNLIDMIKLINNRIYGDYYKLCDLIAEYVVEKIDDKVFLANIQSDDNQLPVYKDLDEYAEYSSETLLAVNAKSIGLLKKMDSFCRDKDKVSEKHLKLTESGFCLGNFLHSFETNNNIIKNQLDLYVKNIEFFNKNHKMILGSIYKKICDLFNEIIGDISFDEDDTQNEIGYSGDYSDNEMDSKTLGTRDICCKNKNEDCDEHEHEHEDYDEHEDDDDDDENEIILSPDMGGANNGITMD